MKIQITISDENNKEIININSNNRNNFSYVDSYGANNDLYILEDGIKIDRKDKEHETEVFLTLTNSYIQIITKEGNLFFDTKVIEFNKNNDIIFLVYSINNEIRKIEIKYIGV